jgi:hypothetical protein
MLKKKIPCKSAIYKGFKVPRPVIEPGWIAPLVFETSASTDSAIWAYGFLVKAVQRYIENMIKANFRRSILKRIFIK